MVLPSSANPVPSVTPPQAHRPPAVTPDGRYLVVRGRLWRRANPALSEHARAALVHALMDARRGVRDARRADDRDAERRHRAAVHAAKVALGERGATWWDDGAPDYNRRLARNTPYAAWWAAELARDDAGASPAGPPSVG